MNGKNRSYILGVAGGYLVYLAYQLFENRNNPEAGMSPPVWIFFMVLFVLIGAGLMVYAVRLWKTADREEKENREKQDTDDGNAIK